jgi:hypothetical protein
VSRRKLTKSDFAALNKIVAGVYYPPGQETRAQLTTHANPVGPRGGGAGDPRARARGIEGHVHTLPLTPAHTVSLRIHSVLCT